MKDRISAYALAALFAVAGVTHFISPEPFEEIVPPQLGDARFWVLSSGAAELIVGALLLKRKTRRFGAWLSVILLILVFPANVYAALNDGYSTLQPPLNSAAAAWLRLPLQAVLIWWALRVAKTTCNES